MKKFLTLIALLTNGLLASAQSNTVNGTIVDCNGDPVVGHPVLIKTDSSSSGVGYYNIVYTNASGYYIDPAITYGGAGLPESIYIKTMDPFPGTTVYNATESPTSGGNTYTHDFSVECATSDSTGGGDSTDTGGGDSTTLSISTNQHNFTCTVYPNPMDHCLYINSANLNQVSNIAFYDITGREMMLLPVLSERNVSINTQNLEGGSYILVLLNASNQPLYKQKLLKR